MLVETHLQGTKLATAAQELSRSRWQLESLPAYETGRGGTTGGQFFCSCEGQSTYRLHQYDLDGNGFLANVLQRQPWEIVLVSIYLVKCGEDLNSKANSTIRGALAAGASGCLGCHWRFSGTTRAVGRPSTFKCVES